MRRAVRLLLLALLPRAVSAQGVTTAAIQGTVSSADGSPIAGAIVRVTNTSDGRYWEVASRSAGVYLLENVAVGGPYRIEARAVGFVAETRTGLVLTLGARLVADFALRAATLELAAVTIEATADRVFDASRTGPAEVVSAARIAMLPNLGRDFLTLTLLSPQVAISPSSRRAPSGGLTIGGANRLLNAFRIDGGVNYDTYNGGLPGRETLPRPISLEALQEVQVLAAPFDVRYGGFGGGLANAVTKSGTNTVHGSAFTYLADAFLVGKGAAGVPAQGFTSWQYGGTIGGPIVRDRSHYFLSVDIQHRQVPDPGPLITDTAGGADFTNIGVRYSSAVRFQDILRDTFGLDPGTLGPSNGSVPATDVFGKITVQLGRNSQLDLSHHYADGERQGFLDRQSGQYALTSFGRRDPSTANASRLIWSSLPGGRWSNELILSRLGLRDVCHPNGPYPVIRVGADGGILLAGSQPSCLTAVTQTALEVTDNLTAAFGAHVATVGVHLETFRFEDAHLQGQAGAWDFVNLDSLAARHGSHYERTLPGPSESGAVVFHAWQLGVYAQDGWRPVRGLTLTAGLRLDVPILPDGIATYVPLRDSLGADSGQRPGGGVFWSPRLGVNYDLHEHTILRAGIGVFTDHIPYSWVGSAYRDDGSQLALICDGTNVPPSFDPINQPAACANTSGTTPRLSFFDPGVRLPQDLKASLGVDHRLPAGVIGTLDVLYHEGLHQLYFSPANLPSPVGVEAGEGDRPLYGTIPTTTTTGSAQPAWRFPSLGQVVRVSSRSGDMSLVVAVKLRRRFGDRGEVSALYAHTRARDRMSLVNFVAVANLQNTPLDGTLEDRRLRTSYFEIPHRVEVDGSVALPYGARLALQYAGASGTPFTYTINGDANADGIGGPLVNDIVYVPRDRADIALDGNGRGPGLGTLAEQDSVYAVLDSTIRAVPCLRKQRGRILARNSCRNPWFGSLNARVTKALPAVSGHSLELTADVYNVLNLLNSRWGQARALAVNPPAQPLLQLVGYDAAGARGVYRRVPMPLTQLEDGASRWQMELSVRYVF